jgi:putative redox protein
MEIMDKESGSKLMVSLTKNHPLTAVMRYGKHELFIDEPVEAGGSDKGPDPYAYILGALGACTAITMELYASRKGWDLEKVEVFLSHEKSYRQDCENCKDDFAKLSHINRIIKVYGKLDEEQVRRLEAIAEKCPVHKTLEKGIRIETSTSQGLLKA